jgi:hypothetical protein
MNILGFFTSKIIKMRRIQDSSNIYLQMRAEVHASTGTFFDSAQTLLGLNYLTFLNQ